MYYIRVCFSIIWGIYCKLYILYLVFDFLCTRISLCTVTCNTLSYLLHYCYPPLTYLAWSKNRSLPQIFRFVRKEIFSPLNSPHRMRCEGHKPLKSSEWWLFYFILICPFWFLDVDFCLAFPLHDLWCPICSISDWNYWMACYCLMYWLIDWMIACCDWLLNCPYIIDSLNWLTMNNAMIYLLFC